MRENKLSVWTFSYNKRYYLTHPWKWFKDLYWNIRNWIHRANKGFAYIDCWNFCTYYPRVAAEALRYLALHNNAYPGIKPWETMEKWREYLNYLANRLERCADSQDMCFGEDRNEYKDALDEIMERTRDWRHDENGNLILSHKEFTPEEEEIRKKYWAREEEIRKADQEYNKETYKWLAEDLGHFWD